MEKLQQEYVLTITFSHAIEMEELLIKKYVDYHEEFNKENKNKELLDSLREFEKNAREHVTLLKDKMIKLNIQG